MQPFRKRRARPFWQRPHNAAALEAQIREEMETHIAMAREHFMAHGATASDAERQARARFGDYDASLHRMYITARQREARMNRRERLSDLMQDVRLSFRLFRRSPLFFLAAIATLAVGIGANGAVFSVLQSTLLQPLPYQNPGELVMVWRNFPNRPPPKGKSHSELVRGALTAPIVLSWREETRKELGDVAAYLTWQGNLESQFDFVANDRTERLNGALVTPNFFSILGAKAEFGRVFTAGDESSNAPLIVLSHALWQRDFGGDPAVVGRGVTLVSGRPRDARTYTVVGVLPTGVQFTYPEATEAWAMVPWSFLRSYPPDALGFNAFMRVPTSMSLAQAQQRAGLFRTGLDRPDESLDQRVAIALEPMRDWIVGGTRPSLMLLGAVAALLLIITCVTVANGLLARVSERRQELAVRAALGAGRGRLVQQLLTEGAMLSLAGALAGTALALAVQPVLRALLPSTLPQVAGNGANVPIVLFGSLVAFVTTILAAVAPAWGGVRTRESERLNHTANFMSAARHTVHLRQFLIGTQACVATALLISATLLLASFWNLGRVPLGFETETVMTMETRLLGPRYKNRDEIARVQSELIARVRAIPGVTEAALTSAVPFRGVDFMNDFKTVAPIVVQPDSTRSPNSPPPGLANTRYVDGGYFGVLRIPLRRGRLFTDAERKGAPLVAVVSESFARELFGDANPIGQLIKGNETLEIIGVVGNVRYASRDKEPWSAVYLSRAQTPENLICIMVRARGDIAGIGAALRRALHEVEPSIPAMKFATLDEIVDDSMASRRFYTVATVAFAALALLLTVTGLAVVVGRVVAERRRELAIRWALGATVARLFRNATIDVILATAIGVLVGTTGVYAAATALAQFLFDITPRSPLPYGASAGAVVLVALLAAAGPVLRFRRLSLSSLLKSE